VASSFLGASFGLASALEVAEAVGGVCSSAIGATL